MSPRISKRLGLLCIYSVFATMQAFPAFSATAVGTETVLNMFGVNLHMDNCCHGNYSNIDKVAEEINYIGARRLRDWPTRDDVIDKWRPIYAKTGAPFHASIPMASPKNQRIALDRIERWLKAYPGLIDVIEGGNEEDSAYSLSQGASLADTAILQSQVYKVGKSAGVKVAQLSVGAGWTAPLWEGNYKKFGSPPADYGNAHTYPNPGEPPASALKRIGDLAAYSVSKSAQVDTTEFGFYRTPKQDELTTGAFMHMAPFSAYLLGHSGLSVYALHDDMTNITGFYRADGTKREFADYWHHTTRLLSDPKGKKLSPKNINITYSNQKAAGRFPLGIKNVLMYKSDGTVWIATYDEERPGAPDGSQTITFDKAYGVVNIYDGRDGKLLKTLKNITTLNLPLPINHVYLVQLVPQQNSKLLEPLGIKGKLSKN
jgi:hypothetical protein